METLIHCDGLVHGFRSQIEAQAEALAYIADAFAKEAEQRQRADRADRIDALQEQVALRVRWCQNAEEAALRDFKTDRPMRSLSKAVGTGLGVWLRRGSDPVLSGMAVLKMELDRTVPFGKVVVTVGPGGIPDQCDVVSLSQQARKKGISEALAAKALVAKGYQVVDPQNLLTALRQVKIDLLGGAVVLPLRGAQLQAYLLSAAPKAGGDGPSYTDVVAPETRFNFVPAGQARTISSQHFHSTS